MINDFYISNIQPKVEVVDLSGDIAATIPELLEDRFHEVTLVIADSITQIYNDVTLQRIANTRKQGLQINVVEIKFGIILEVEGGVVVTRAKGGATFEVTISFNLDSE